MGKPEKITRTKRDSWAKIKTDLRIDGCTNSLGSEQCLRRILAEHFSSACPHCRQRSLEMAERDSRKGKG